jgi:hypothetical protein
MCQPAPASLLTGIGRLVIALADRLQARALQFRVAKLLWRFQARVGRKAAALELAASA